MKNLDVLRIENNTNLQYNIVIHSKQYRERLIQNNTIRIQRNVIRAIICIYVYIYIYIYIYIYAVLNGSAKPRSGSNGNKTSGGKGKTRTKSNAWHSAPPEPTPKLPAMGKGAKGVDKTVRKGAKGDKPKKEGQFETPIKSSKKNDKGGKKDKKEKKHKHRESSDDDDDKKGPKKEKVEKKSKKKKAMISALKTISKKDKGKTLCADRNNFLFQLFPVL